MTPVYNVIIDDVNRKEFKAYNVFNNHYMNEFMKKYKKKPTKDRNIKDFEEQLDRECRYAFWSKCEYEIILGTWPQTEREEKVDVYWQLKNNWPIFVNYAWDFVKPKVKSNK